MVWLVAAVGCLGNRVTEVRDDLERLEAQVADLRQQREVLQHILDESPPPTQSQRMDLGPAEAEPDAPLPAGSRRQPDVVLLSIDTLRADHLGSYGYERETSPFFDRLAAEGTRFTEAWAPAPWTLPSHATMLSGLLPHNHGAVEDHLRVPPDVDFVSSAFQRAGYRTAAIVSTLFVSSRYGFDRGFDHFEDFGIREKKENHLSLVDADHVFAHARHFAQSQDPGRPVFLFLHVYDVHYGYDPPPPFNETFDRPAEWGDEKYRSYHTYMRRMIDAEQLEHQVAQYDEEIRFVDHHFERLIDAFAAAGREVLVAVTADHGEEFGERGSWGHGHTLFPEQLHVPWILHGPGVRRGVVDRRVGLEDVAPTLAELAGIRFSASDGRSRAPLARGRRGRGGSVAARFASTSRFESHVLRWHEPPWDLYVDVANRVRHLCDRSTDPACRSNVYRQNPELGQRLFGELLGYVGEPWRVVEPGVVEVHQGTLWRDGVRHNDALGVAAGDRLTVLPGDASVRFGHDGNEQGPWQPLGGTTPGRGCGLKFTGRAVVGAELVTTDEEKEMLRELGYLQDDGPAEAIADGPVDCP